jgi:TRAP-type C4-dicarboxylate transport system permease small subunit
MVPLQRFLAWVFGVVFVALSVVVSVETLSRKLFNFSIQGADELGGYALAIGSVMAFSLALVGRNHIRVDVFHERFPKRMQAWMNALSYVLMAVFAVTIAYVAFKVVQDTRAYGSTAPTPWQTPLIWPQSVWYAGLFVFALVTLAYAARAVLLLLQGRIDELNHEFQPKSVKEEVEEEVDDFAKRSDATASGAGAAPVAPATREAV